jgi:hypothetical protein
MYARQVRWTSGDPSHVHADKRVTAGGVLRPGRDESVTILNRTLQ